LNTLLESPGNILEICSVKFVDILHYLRDINRFYITLNIAELETDLLLISNDLPQEFTD